MSKTVTAWQAFLRGRFDTSIAAVSPAVCVPPHLPPPPKGRTVVIGAGNDGYRFFAALDRLVVTGRTRTNVNDFRAINLPA